MINFNKFSNLIFKSCHHIGLPGPIGLTGAQGEIGDIGYVGLPGLKNTEK